MDDETGGIKQNKEGTNNNKRNPNFRRKNQKFIYKPAISVLAFSPSFSWQETIKPTVGNPQVRVMKGSPHRWTPSGNNYGFITPSEGY